MLSPVGDSVGSGNSRFVDLDPDDPVAEIGWVDGRHRRSSRVWLLCRVHLATRKVGSLHDQIAKP